MAESTTAGQRMRNLFEALADSVETASDEEIIEDCIEAGEDPAAVAEHTRELLRATMRKFEARKTAGA
jgi:hypothetical protein